MKISTFWLKSCVFVWAFLFVNPTVFSKPDLDLKKAIPTDLYDSIDLGKMGLKREIFDKAFQGWIRLQKEGYLSKPELLTIADMSQSSCSKRLYIIDMAKRAILMNTYVAHGRNSGEEFAKKFSNTAESYMTSLGFYVTGDIYNGSHGVSMKLKGVEKGINDIAESRKIVLHGADYVSESFIKQHGRLGRSYGCPAVPQDECKQIVNLIQGGSGLFIYHPDRSYNDKSTMLTIVQ